MPGKELIPARTVLAFHMLPAGCRERFVWFVAMSF
jgi:hypothetical protein